MTNDLYHTPPPAPRPSAPPPPPPPPPAYAVYAEAPSNVKNGQSIAALVLGCCSILFYVTLIVPALAIIFGTIAIRAQKEAGQKVSGMAIAGLVLGIVFGLIGLVFWIALA